MRVVSSHAGSGATGSGDLIDIVGTTCMEHDCLHSGYSGPLTLNDYLIFDNVGAYNTVMKPPFIHPCPPILAYRSTLDEFEVVKRQEELADVFATYLI